MKFSRPWLRSAVRAWLCSTRRTLFVVCSLTLLGACATESGASDGTGVTRDAASAWPAPSLPGEASVPTLGDAATTAAPDGQVSEAGMTPTDSGPPRADAAVQADAGLDAAAPDGGIAPDGGAAPGRMMSCLPSATLKPGKSTFRLMRDGAQREVNVYVPRSYDGKKALPLVVDFHGLHEGAGLHEVISEWDDTVEQNQYVVAMPQGLQNAWNLGPCCTESRAVDDVQFARDLVAKIVADGCIDTQRIYATGYSNGGGMSFKVACEAADLFAAVAPAAFDLLEEMTCKPARPLSVFIFRGTEDPIVPYAGGPSTPPTLYPLSEIHFLGAEKTFQRWAELNGCTDTASASGAGCKTHTQCMAGVKVTLCTQQGGGHDGSSPGPAWPMLKEFAL